MEERPDRLLVLCLLAALVILPVVAGCTVVTQDQKDWLADKANRSAAYVTLMDYGKTTAEQDKEWIRSQDQSWQLWAEKVKLGLAAPSFMAKEEDK